MDKRELVTQATTIIHNIIYLTLATSDKNNQPWNSPVYCAFDEKYNFYWASYTENQHSKNIVENENVFAVIYDSTVPEGTGVGVYFKGTAHQLGVKNSLEILKAIQLLYSRKNKKLKTVTEFLDSFPRRIYKFVPTQIWINSTSTINTNAIDTRIEITPLLLKR